MMRKQDQRLARGVLTALLTVGACSAMAGEQGEWILRAGVSVVDPDSSNDARLRNNLGGSELSVDENTQLGVTAAYYVRDNIAVELLASTPFDHDIQLSGVGEIGSAKHLPPTLSVLYSLPALSSFEISPYVGLGLNYTIFMEDRSSLGALDLDDSLGLALQIGADVPVSDTMGVNASLRWIDINTDVDLGGTNLGELEIDPWVYSLGLYCRF